MQTLLRQYQRAIALALLGLLLVTALLGIVTYFRMLEPSDRLPSKADAVVVLAGGFGERLPRGVELMETGIADTLVINLGNGRWTAHAVNAINAWCQHGRADYEVVCVAAEPDSTRGEASGFAQLADARGWNSVVVVSSDFHLWRALLWFERCFEGEVFGAPATSDKTIGLVVHEWIGLIVQSTFQRSCPDQGPSVS